MDAFPKPWANPEVSTISFKASFGVQWLTTRRSCPGSPRLCDTSGSDSPKYVRYPDTACASLKPVVQSTVYVQQQPALQHPGSPPPRCLPRCPHTSMGAFSRASSYPEVSTISFEASFGARSLTTRRSCPGSPRPCDDSRSDSPKSVHYTDTTCTSLTLVVQPTVHMQRQSALLHLDLSPFLTAPTPPWAHSQGLRHT